ncbi:MAG: YraN family protein [Gammaproteobacteria bacterium]|jgi:putative endonuclease|nr:YraN family protein [Gammaproteobacteria bacterium]MBT4494258.1 YraN family protein [Gammaproteobacteria bacterium]MBT7369289.1 YraN family protein [Gammaproteobacteria bacterium]
MTNAQEAGRQAEAQAEQFLINHGFKLVTRNYSAKTGEIDLIMSKDELLVFVEVRLRSHGGYGTGADSITHPKQRRIINTAKRYLQSVRKAPWQSYRFDVVSIGQSLDWIPGAFTLD